MMRVVLALVLTAAVASPAPTGFLRPRGQPLPNVSLPKLDGTMGELSALGGKPLLIFNFASW